MEKTLELYEEELAKVKIGLHASEKEILAARQHEETLLKKHRKLENNQNRIVKKIKKLKTVNSCPVGTKDDAVVKLVTAEALFLHVLKEDPIFTCVDDCDDVEKVYLTPNNILFKSSIDNISIYNTMLHWDGEKPWIWDEYSHTWDADTGDCEELEPFIEKMYVYTLDKLATEALEESLAES